MSELLNFLWLLICLVGVFVVIAAALAPLEALMWWAGWTRRPAPEASLESESAAPSAQANAYIIYLSGVAAIDPSGMHPKEKTFLDLLQTQMPEAVVVRDVFAYSVTNNPLTGERALGWLWKKINALSVKRGKRLTDWFGLGLVIVRNITQLLVSADARYGPAYSFGVAKEIAESLMRKGYVFGSRAPVVLLGYSGGGQVAVGSVPYLARILQCPVWVIGIGGVYSDDEGILHVRHLYQLTGTRDFTWRLGEILFPGHWGIFPYAAWQRARARKLISFVDMGPMKHALKGDYFSRSTKTADGQTHAEKTVATIVQLVQEIQSEQAWALKTGRRA